MKISRTIITSTLKPLKVIAIHFNCKSRSHFSLALHVPSQGSLIIWIPIQTFHTVKMYVAIENSIATQIMQWSSLQYVENVNLYETIIWQMLLDSSRNTWGILSPLEKMELLWKRDGTLHRVYYRLASTSATLTSRHGGRPLDWCIIEF